MVALVSLVFSLLVVSSTWALPLASRATQPILKFPPITSKGIFCFIPIPMIQNALCPRQTSNSLTVSTPLGTAQGASDNSNAARFAVRYGTAARWQMSTVVTSWDLPFGASNASGLPLPCPQTDLDASGYSEDCLSMLLYVPASISTGSGVPTFMWIHGGSFLTGSATDPGLDGSTLAAATNSIVAVVQYRLGALGFMAPSGSTNLAVQDIMTAMSFLQKIVPSFGGDSSKITLAGQSSGANMIRALLAVPSASSMFQSAILQSDPMDYGFLNTTIQETMQNYYNQQLPCDSVDTSCLDSLSLDTVLGAQNNLTDNANNLSPAAGYAEPIRPVRDNMLITSTLDSTSPFPTVTKPILLSTVADEAMVTIYDAYTSPVSATEYGEAVDYTFGQPRGARILSSQTYAMPVAANGSDIAQDARPQLQTLGTDQVWRCATWTFARNWVSNGGQAFVGMYVVGATYPGNQAVPQCTESGAVCHQDDIEIVFGTVPNPTSEQSALITEMQARYSAFLRTGNPNTGPYTTWQAATNNSVYTLELGGSSEAAVGACEVDYWGDYVQYDYQVFNI
ncbi:hypothetical protein AcV5_006369 [Taiwanofungus camphoratus]|nr:hypothetical protein AcV5_006369 [Antrodia cinnamomea]